VSDPVNEPVNLTWQTPGRPEKWPSSAAGPGKGGGDRERDQLARGRGEREKGNGQDASEAVSILAWKRANIRGNG